MFLLALNFSRGAQAAPSCSPGLRLPPQCLINLFGIESHDYRTINDDHGSGHIPEFLEVGQGARILRDVLLLELYALLRKILLRLVAEHSAMLRVDDDVLHLFSPCAGFVPLVSNR